MRYSAESFRRPCTCIKSGGRTTPECWCNLFLDDKAFGVLVDDFAKAMKEKFHKKWAEGYRGWDDPEWTKEKIMQALKDHLNKGDAVDIANFVAFLWNKQQEPKEASNGNAE